MVETHSEHLFRRMQTLIARRQASTAQCRMLFVERRGADAVLVPLDVDEFGAVRNWPAAVLWRRDGRGARAGPRPCTAFARGEPVAEAGALQARLVDTNVLIVASAADAGSPFGAEATPSKKPRCASRCSTGSKPS